MNILPTIRKSSYLNFDKLNYIFLRQSIDEKGLFFKLNPKDSDFGTHETVLTNLVGTLVKLSETGQFAPYLAESFNTSKDGLTWTFNIRPNLTCDDGTPITAKSFATAFSQSLKRYSKFSKVIDFELLEGWADFTSGKSQSITGLQFEDNKLVFKLTTQPENFIGHLRLPYFGFWCSNNFDANGEFKEDSKFISSGPYKVISSEKNAILLEKRSDWFSISEESPGKILFSYSTPDKLSDSAENTIVEVLGRDKVVNLPSFQEIKSPPSLMWTMVVAPTKPGPFANVVNRRAFADRVIELKKTSPLFSSFYFYPSKPTDVKLRSELTAYTSEMKGKKISFAFANRNYTQQETDEIKRITIEALKDSGAQVEFSINDPLEDNWRHRLLSNQEFDIRMNGVDQGGYPKNRTIKMMFCSNLGVCYPDPSGRICKIVDHQDKTGGPIPKEYIAEFNQALYDDASLVPLTHFGTHWMVTKDLDLTTLPPTSGIFHFEGIRLK
jgi:hypothetical protein